MAHRIGGFLTTAYGPPWGGIEGGTAGASSSPTASGYVLHTGRQVAAVAVDPSLIPYGTKLRIPNNPFHDPNIIFTAVDTGGAIKGRHIDFYVATPNKANNWYQGGGQTVEIVGHGSPHDVAMIGGHSPAAATLPGQAPARAGTPARTVQSTAFDAAGFQDQRRQAALAGLLKTKSPFELGTGASKSPLLGLLNPNVPSRADYTSTTTKTIPGTPAQRAPGAPRQARIPGGLGKVYFAPGADRAGVPTGSLVKGLLAHVAATAGLPLTVGTGTNHNQYTVNGNVSDHWSGNGADIPVPVDSRKGDLIAGRALMYLGVSRAQARHMAQQGGLFNVTPSSGPFRGHRVQVIWKTYEGGNHHNHVHIGIRP